MFAKLYGTDKDPLRRPVLTNERKHDSTRTKVNKRRVI